MTEKKHTQIRLPSGRNALESSCPGDLFHNNKTDELYVIRHISEKKLEFTVFDRHSLEKRSSVELSGSNEVLEVLHSLTPIFAMELFDVNSFLIAQLTKSYNTLHDKAIDSFHVIKQAKEIIGVNDDAPLTDFLDKLIQLVVHQK